MFQVLFASIKFYKGAKVCVKYLICITSSNPQKCQLPSCFAHLFKFATYHIFHYSVLLILCVLKYDRFKSLQIHMKLERLSLFFKLYFCFLLSHISYLYKNCVL